MSSFRSMVRKIDIVLAAPGDADGARMVVEAVVDQMNLGAAQKAGARLDLTPMDDGSLPASTPDGFAIFVGVLGTSFSKTGIDDARAARVRFLAAYDKFLADPNTLRMLFFISDEAVPPSRIEPDQLALVREFQNRLKADGLRAYVFDGREDLRTLFEAKLERIVVDLPLPAETKPDEPKSTELEPTAGSEPPAADVVPTESQPEKPQGPDATLDHRLAPKLSPAANDDRFVLAAMTPLTPELLAEIDRKAWDMVQALDLINDMIGFMATDARRHLQAHKNDEPADPQMGLIFNMMSRKEEDDFTAFADSAEQKIAMLKEIYQTVLNAMRHEYYQRRPELEASDYDEEVLDRTFRAVAKFSGPLRAAAPHLQAFRGRVSGLRRTTAEFHKAKQQSLEFLDRFLSDLTTLRSMLARNPASEASSKS